MILKIKDDFGKSGWYLFDGIESVRYSLINLSEANKSMEPNKHFLRKDEPVVESILLDVYFKDKHQETWLSCVPTYLLNDDGKTIERILG